MTEVQLSSLETEIQNLIEIAISTREFAYCPYSKYAVGAALLCQNGEIFTGVNVENASYGGAICAERTAIVKAVSVGQKSYKAIAVSASPPGPSCKIPSPCGICRQFISEFGKDIPIYISDPQKSCILKTSINELLPFSFSFE